MSPLSAGIEIGPRKIASRFYAGLPTISFWFRFRPRAELMQTQAFLLMQCLHLSLRCLGGSRCKPGGARACITGLIKPSTVLAWECPARFLGC